ncbi:response regulator [Colwellia sp. 20A7]|uniref:response regulator n=1 Tax=Colwellia sp. 20A7 TaxID=2689569 RepID=UPI0013587419|nr:response regulator [Colwellia sp. 20A7]
MGHILLVEDDLRLANLIAKFLKQNGFHVSMLHQGDSVVNFLQKHSPDLIILDVMLPKEDGFSVCRKIRNSYAQPIIFLTAKDSDFDHVLGLEIGADDYIIKPVEPHVLLARINMLMRRKKHSEKMSVDNLTFGQLSIFKTSRQVTLSSEPIELTSHEFELLWLLAINAGEPQSREYIHKQMIGREYDGLDRSVDVRVSRLRKKLGDCTKNPYRIITVWGKGYLFSSSAWEEIHAS